MKSMMSTDSLDCTTSAEIEANNRAKNATVEETASNGTLELHATHSTGDASGMTGERSIVLPSAPTLTDQLKYYMLCCREYGAQPDPSVSIALQNPSVSHLGVHYGHFGLRDMLPLCEVLKHCVHIRTMDLAYCDLQSSGAFVLGNILKENNVIEKVNLGYNRIGRHGASALGDALAVNQRLKCLKLRGNVMTAKCAMLLARGLAENRTLNHLDVSNNNITVDGINALQQAIEVRCKKFCLEPNFRLEIDGNFWMEELVNSITHGVGLVLAIIFGGILLDEARQADKHPPSYYWSCLVFVFSLICLYTCSTLAHSFHRMKLTGTVFIILDHSCISILIAGSYTPFCMVTLGHMWTGTALCIAVWVLAVIGVTISLLGEAWRKVELGLFILMGWLLLPSTKYVYECMEPAGLSWLVGGGAMYMIGVHFFIKGQTVPIHHAIWHLFVVAGSACHYIAIYLYVRPCAAVTGVNDDSRMWFAKHAEL